MTKRTGRWKYAVTTPSSFAVHPSTGGEFLNVHCSPFPSDGGVPRSVKHGERSRLWFTIPLQWRGALQGRGGHPSAVVLR